MPSFPQPRINPSMGPDTVLQGDRWRIGVITESLIRLEWQDDGVFEDHATQMVANRNWDVTPQFTHTVRNELLIVDTPTLRLTYDMQPFSKEGLSIVVKGVANSQMMHKTATCTAPHVRSTLSTEQPSWNPVSSRVTAGP